MPPLRAGLLKRKSKPTDDTEPALPEEPKWVLPAAQLHDDDDGDSTDQETHGHTSDEDRDEVLLGDEDVLSGSEEEQDTDTNSDQSSELTDSDGSSETSTEESGIGHTPSSGEEDKYTQHDTSQGNDNKVKKRVKKKENVKLKSKKSEDSAGSSVGSTGSTGNTGNTGNHNIVLERDEYSSGDSSDEEERVNTVGEVPRWWYDEYPHVGYDLQGRRLLRPSTRDRVDDFLRSVEDPDFWRTVKDPATGQDVVLAAEDLQLLAALREGRAPGAAEGAHEPWVEWFSREVLATPVRALPDHKRSFLPSSSERAAVARLVHALKMGWSTTRAQQAEQRRRRRERRVYDLWGAATDETAAAPRAGPRHLPAPRRPPPGHAESYNPPPEFLLDSREMREWRRQSATPWLRKYTFLPERHSSLRRVPAYPRYVRERFLRCLDLYLAPRALKMRLTLSPEELVPQLPSPRDLQPFPTAAVLTLQGHTDVVRSCDFDPTGQYLVSGSDDGYVKMWETSTGRCLRTVQCGAPVRCVRWCPARGLAIVAAAAGPRLLLLCPGAAAGSSRLVADTELLLSSPPAQPPRTPDARTAAAVSWPPVLPEDWARGVRLQLVHFKDVIHVCWQARGDYVCVTLADGGARSVLVHQVSSRRSQAPFSRAPGLVQCAMFHPTRPHLFVATQRAVRVYDLLQQRLLRKLSPGAQWLSGLALHPGGDNLLAVSYDRKAAWFDLELSARPYRTLRLHGGAVRAASYHRRYPLFATGGDDPYVVVSHGAVYTSLLQNPLLVPLKQLRAAPQQDGLCVLDLAFHPTQPWLLTARADSTLVLYA